MSNNPLRGIDIDAIQLALDELTVEADKDSILFQETTDKLRSAEVLYSYLARDHIKKSIPASVFRFLGISNSPKDPGEEAMLEAYKENLRVLRKELDDLSKKCNDRLRLIESIRVIVRNM